MADIRILDLPNPGEYLSFPEYECAVQTSKSDCDEEDHSRSNARSGSYSSVKEDVDGQPQSFFSRRRSVIESNTRPASDLQFESQSVQPAKRRRHDDRSTVTIESLPTEVLECVFSNLILDLPPNGHAKRNEDLMACLTLSKRLHPAVLTVLYRTVTFPHSLVFDKFYTKCLKAQPQIGTLIRRLDLSHFNPLGFGRTQKDRGEAQYFTATSFLGCLELIPNVQEILLQEHVDEDITPEVLRTLLFKLPRLRAIDFCGAYRSPFVNAFSTVITELKDKARRNLGVERLSLHKCDTLPGSEIALLLSRLPRLTILDLAHTRIDDEGLMSIPSTARLTHLNLGRCSQITGPGAVEFLTQHPAARNLQYLNLSCDISRYRLLRETDVDELLPALPSTLRSLNLNGAKIGASHVRHLRRLVSHLEELGLSHCNLSLAEIRSLFETSTYHDSDESDDEDEEFFPGSMLRYIDLTGVASITQSSLFSSAAQLLTDASQPLEVIEVAPALATSLKTTKAMNARIGWTIKEFGRRNWYVREQKVQEDPGRSWKLGSKWWGTRKVPVAWSEVGGIYGHYMFKA